MLSIDTNNQYHPDIRLFQISDHLQFTLGSDNRLFTVYRKRKFSLINCSHSDNAGARPSRNMEAVCSYNCSSVILWWSAEQNLSTRDIKRLSCEWRNSSRRIVSLISVHRTLVLTAPPLEAVFHVRSVPLWWKVISLRSKPLLGCFTLYDAIEL